jgi:hypothetical protein
MNTINFNVIDSKSEAVEKTKQVEIDITGKSILEIVNEVNTHLTSAISDMLVRIEKLEKRVLSEK